MKRKKKERSGPSGILDKIDTGESICTLQGNSHEN